MIWSADMARILPSFTLHVYGQNLPALTLHRHRKRPATNLTIRREPLAPNKRIHPNRAALSAIRATNLRALFHSNTIQCIYWLLVFRSRGVSQNVAIYISGVMPLPRITDQTSVPL